MSVAEEKAREELHSRKHVTASHNLFHGEVFLLVQSSVGGRGGDWGGRCFQLPRPSHCARRHRRSSPRAALSSPLDRRNRWNTCKEYSMFTFKSLNTYVLLNGSISRWLKAVMTGLWLDVVGRDEWQAVVLWKGNKKINLISLSLQKLPKNGSKRF